MCTITHLLWRKIIKLTVLLEYIIIVTEHEKTGLMYTKYIFLYYGTYLLYCLRYQIPVNCIRFP